MDDIVADEALAERLSGSPGQSFIRIEGFRYDQSNPERPMGHVVAHVDAAFGRIREAAWELDRSIVETLERLYGVRVARIQQEVTAVALEPEMAARLHAEAYSPALAIRRTYLSESGRSFECSDSLFPSGRFVYRTELTQ